MGLKARALRAKTLRACLGAWQRPSIAAALGSPACDPGTATEPQLMVRAWAYLPDHDPALAATRFLADPAWTSGFDLARGVDLLIRMGSTPTTNAEPG